MTSRRFSEKTKTCPYDPLHQVLSHRFALHLIKCRKQHPNADVKVCPFNATHHIVPSGNYEWHVENCRDRAALKTDLTLDDMENQQQLMPAVATPPLDDDWDMDMEGVVPFNPSQAAMRKNVVRCVQGYSTKAERRRFRKEENARLASLENTQTKSTDDNGAKNLFKTDKC